MANNFLLLAIQQNISSTNFYSEKKSKVFIFDKINLTCGDIMEVAITRMSSRGQVVIPAEMREDMQEGDKLIIIKNNHQLIMKKADKLDENFEEDIEFARRTEEALKRIEEGKGIKMEFDAFVEEMKKW